MLTKIKLMVLLFWTVVLSATAVTAEKKDIALLTFCHGDSVSLRWAPTSQALFAASAKRGYVVQRRVVGQQQWANLTEVLFPASNLQMEQLEDEHPDVVAVREALYNNQQEPKSKAEQELLFGMALFGCDIDLKVARAAALHFVDKQVRKGETYQYRVVFANEAKNEGANVQLVIVDTKVPTVLPSPTGLNAQFGEHRVMLDWNVAGYDGYYSAYRIERSTDKVHFAPVNDRPIVQAYTTEAMKDVAIYSDSLPNQDSVFYYRMKGYSPFGIYGPASNVVKGSGKFNFNLVDVVIDTVIMNDKKKQGTIKWSVDKQYAKKIKGFKIVKTHDFQEFGLVDDVLIPASKRQYSVRLTDRSAYYSVVALGYKPNQETHSSFYLGFRTDTIPPSVPQGLKAVIDSAGVARVSWNASPESDVLGYRLYFSNTGREDDYFTATDTIIVGTSFTDTLDLGTLSNSIYYKVLALDRRYNSSELSAAVRLMKPDTIAPVKVVFQLLQQPNEQVLVQWENSPSDDVERMELYRQIDDTGKVVLLKSYAIGRRTPTKYEDPYTFRGEQVQYFMKVYDRVGNMSQSSTNRMVTKGERPECIGQLTVRVTDQESDKRIRLSWTNNHVAQIQRYVVYRKEDGGRMLPVASVGATTVFYDDKQISTGSKYVYIVRAISTERVCPALYSDEVEFVGAYK